MDELSPPALASLEDPRVNTTFCRHVHTPHGEVTLLGVVHDHPASIARVRHCLETLQPEILALELPRVAIPLYRHVARESAVSSSFGGEMSAAIRAASDADVVGIDGPNVTYLRRLGARLIADRAPPSVTRRVLSSVTSATREALACRLAATLTSSTSMTLTPGEAISYDCSPDDSPARQAEHERAHVAGVQALLGKPGGARAYRDETREQCMIDALESLRGDGHVVAVVGVDHLDTLEAGLDTGASAHRTGRSDG